MKLDLDDLISLFLATAETMDDSPIELHFVGCNDEEEMKAFEEYLKSKYKAEAEMEEKEAEKLKNQDSHQKSPEAFRSIWGRQMDIQLAMMVGGLYEGFRSQPDILKVPVDDTRLFSYQVQQLMSEIGEVLEADKRWKNARNNHYDKSEKLDELCDCMIVLLNIIMFSGFTYNDFMTALENKQMKVDARLRNEIKNKAKEGVTKDE